jgi:hypothetical protein
MHIDNGDAHSIIETKDSARLVQDAPPTLDKCAVERPVVKGYGFPPQRCHGWII